MTVMCRFIIDKMPLIFSTPRYFGHIPLLAVPWPHPQPSPVQRPRAVMTERRWATALSHAPRYSTDVSHSGAALCHTTLLPGSRAMLLHSVPSVWLVESRPSGFESYLKVRRMFRDCVIVARRTVRRKWLRLVDSSSSCVRRSRLNSGTSGVTTFIRIVREPRLLLLVATSEGTPQVSAPLIRTYPENWL